MSRNRCIASTEQIRRAVYLLIYIKPLDAFTSGAERLQSELVQTFPNETNVTFAHIIREPLKNSPIHRVCV